MDPERQQRLNEIAAIAVRLESQTGVPAHLTVAQWAIESQWGAKPVGHANYFGIKAAQRNPLQVVVPTHENIGGALVPQDLAFSDYPSLEASAADYAWLISHGTPYARAWSRFQQDHDDLALIDSIAHVYSTSPAYASLFQQIACQSNVYDAIVAAGGKPSLHET